MIAAVALLTLLLAGAFLAAPAPSLIVTDLTTDEHLLCRSLPRGQVFSLAFTHSMYGGEVREEYVAVPGGRLRRIAMTTANAAAAEYYAHTAPVVRVGVRFLVDVPAAEFAQIVVRVDRIGNHRLLLGADDINLVTTAGDRHAVRLALRPVGTLDWLAGRGC